MRKVSVFVSILFCAMFTSACIHTFAVQELNQIAAKYLENGDTRSAISRLESSIDLDPDVYESRYNLAVSYIEVNECEKAISQAQAAQKLIKDEPAIVYTLAVAYDCAAHNIYEKKDDSGNIEEVTYNNPAEDLKMGEKFIDYLTKANENYKAYIDLAPTADDREEVMRLIEQNNEKLSQMQSKYQNQ